MKIVLFLALVTFAKGVPLTESQQEFLHHLHLDHLVNEVLHGHHGHHTRDVVQDLQTAFHGLAQTVAESFGHLLQGSLSPLLNLGPELTQTPTKRQLSTIQEALEQQLHNLGEVLFHHLHPDDHAKRAAFSELFESAVNQLAEQLKNSVLQGFQTFLGGLLNNQPVQQPAQYPAKRDMQFDLEGALHNIAEKLKAVFQNAFLGGMVHQPSLMPAKRDNLPLFEPPLSHTQIMHLIQQHTHHTKRAAFSELFESAVNQLAEQLKNSVLQGFQTFLGGLLNNQPVQQPAQYPAKRDMQFDLEGALHNIAEKLKAVLQNAFLGGMVHQPSLMPAKRDNLPLFEPPLSHTQIMHLIQEHTHHTKRAAFSELFESTVNQLAEQLKNSVLQGFQTFLGGLLNNQPVQQPAQYPAKRDMQFDLEGALHNIAEKLKAVLQNAFLGGMVHQPSLMPAKRDNLPLFEPPLTHTQIMHLIQQHTQTPFMDPVKRNFFTDLGHSLSNFGHQLGDALKETGSGLLETLSQQGATLLTQTLQGAASIVGQGASTLSHQLANPQPQS